MRILVCGDSYCVTDPDYPGLHWTEKILDQSPDLEICNLAYGGSSNALIAMQLMQGLKLNPDGVVVSFTVDGRYEYDHDSHVVPEGFSALDIANFTKSRFTTSSYQLNKEKNEKYLEPWRKHASSLVFEKIKNYFFILMVLNTLKVRNIPYCYSLGGFEYKQDYSHIIRSVYLNNELAEHSGRELSLNLWYYGDQPRPYFHVENQEVQWLFSQECLAMLKGKTC